MFDSIIFSLLCIGIILWIIVLHTYISFFPIVGILVVYYIIRFRMQAIIKQQALKQIKQEHNPVKVFVAPTMRFMEWRVAIQTEAHDYVGRSYGRNIVFSDKSKRHSFPSNDLMKYVKDDKNIKTFLNFSSIYRWQQENWMMIQRKLD